MKRARSAALLTILQVAPATIHSFAFPPQLSQGRVGSSLRHLSGGTSMTSQSVAQFPVPLLVEATSGAPLDSAAKTIHDVAEADLAGGCENCMVILRDPASRQVLLQLPNALGWRYHFGVRVQRRSEEPENQLSFRQAAQESALAELSKYPILKARAEASMRERGLMLFTFLSTPPGRFPPMRVRVFDVTVACSGEGGDIGGCWFPFEAVPYDSMWADDVFWMPQLLTAADDFYFEGHFVFDGGPGKDSPLVQHSVALR